MAAKKRSPIPPGVVRITALLLPILLLMACREGEPEITTPDELVGPSRMEKVSLLLNWFPEHQHGGFYTALINGYYADEGLDVTIMPGGPQVPVIQRVASGQVDFGITNADQVIFGRAAQAPVVSLFAPLQDSPRCLMVHEESGITDFTELRNMTIAMNSNDGFAAHLMHHFSLDGVTVVRYPGNIAAFLNDKNYAVQAYSISEIPVARSRGANPQALMLKEAGYNPYTSLLVTSESRKKAKPETVRRMLRASIRGWQAYMEEPNKTNRYILELNPELNSEALAEGWDLMVPLVYPEGTTSENLGHMTRERWAELLDSMETTGQIEPGRVTIDDCFIDPYTDLNEGEES
ncbi:MAG: ABC transporter substrate-binding protein [Candidatus Sumerlaeia bacterium]|nr:ABC transporter substrate-binding protein [Candidatus Sumerlaeia bacterium]